VTCDHRGLGDAWVVNTYVFEQSMDKVHRYANQARRSSLNPDRERFPGFKNRFPFGHPPREHQVTIASHSVVFSVTHGHRVGKEKSPET
jgi:hypothetical protein